MTEASYMLVFPVRRRHLFMFRWKTDRQKNWNAIVMARFVPPCDLYVRYVKTNKSREAFKKYSAWMEECQRIVREDSEK